MPQTGSALAFGVSCFISKATMPCTISLKALLALDQNRRSLPLSFLRTHLNTVLPCRGWSSSVLDTLSTRRSTGLGFSLQQSTHNPRGWLCRLPFGTANIYPGESSVAGIKWGIAPTISQSCPALRENTQPIHPSTQPRLENLMATDAKILV